MARFLDTLVNIFVPNDDYEEEDEYLDDYEEEEAPAPRTAPFSKKSRNEEFEVREPKQKSAKPQKITPIMKQSRKQVNGMGMEVCVIKPTKFDESGREITDSLLSNQSVVLNLEGIDIELAQRIVDYAYGTCYALRGNFRAVTKSIILITPSSVDITGDDLDSVSNSIAGADDEIFL